jgi:hypothetical protein
VALVQTKLACGRKDEGIKEKPAGAAAKEGKSCRWGGTVLKITNKQYRKGLFQNGAAFFSAEERKKKTTRSNVCRCRLLLKK